MAFVERIDLRSRGGKVWQDGNQYRAFTSLAPLHYESTPESGVFDSAIDCTPVRVNNAQLDGWRIQTNGWHYALGQPVGKSDGWVGFGGRGGQNWLQFRLARLGYLYVPVGSPVLAANWFDIGGAPNYTRANLSSQVNSIDYGAQGSQSVESVATWAGLWSTPGGGDVSARWRVDGGQLKEEIVINQAGRDWIAANRPPPFFGIPAAQSYFGMVFQLDWTDIPKRVVNGLERAASDDFTDDDGGLELRDSLDRLLAFLPVDDVYAGSGRGRQSVRLRKRFWQDIDGNHYLAVGAPVTQINALPAGDLIFDPTVNLQIGSTGNDGMSDAGGGFDNTICWCGDFGGNDEAPFFYFTSVTVPNAATIDSADLTLRRTNSAGGVDNVDTKFSCEAADNPSAPTTQAQHAGRTRTTANTTLDPTTWSAGGDEVVSIISAVQEVVNRAGWASGNTLGVLWDTRVNVPSNNELEVQDYSAGASNAAKLDITYTVSALAYEQEGFRWRNDDGSETTATWRQTQDTNDSVAKETPLRLRMLVNATNDPPAAHYKLQYKPPGADTWEDV